MTVPNYSQPYPPAKHVNDFDFYQATVIIIVNRIRCANRMISPGPLDPDYRAWRTACDHCKAQRPAVYAEAERTAWEVFSQEVGNPPKEVTFSEMERVYWLGLPPTCRECGEAIAIVDGLCADCYADNRNFAR